MNIDKYKKLKLLSPHIIVFKEDQAGWDNRNEFYEVINSSNKDIPMGKKVILNQNQLKEIGKGVYLITSQDVAGINEEI